MKPPKKIKKQSDRGRLRAEVGKLQFDYLVRKRGARCELSGRPPKALGRFHILSVGAHPKLEFCDENVLLVNWLPHHYHWHHSYEKAKEIEKLIIKVSGENYKDRLYVLEKLQQKISMFYLKNLKFWYERELKNEND